ncbi:MAG: ABC transporter ATP-binding protein/permease [Erysipelotrichaceae bacterium]|nr:ABC transporter ATP-binding protein/permease [Erysipelotrichaceae bacterium]
MLQLKSIKKVYKTNDLDVIALNNVSIDFRKSEFVSILGPSGCGKTTLLNIIGGLDKYTDGDLIIDNKSTKKFKSTDFDSYRNHQIGFVFQSYNLIIHQSVLANVELALTLSGVSKKERRKRAIEALDKVGLHEQINKRPNQLSGGQMQRVAIARAIVNNPEIILADEPTGALDSKTSLQIMDLLKEISKEKLIIMVTHNEELAYKYSTRVVKLLDGNIIEDTNPYKIEDNQKEDFKVKKIAMSFLTALSLSFNNLLTKKGRTILTSFAGSIGIIGIALILSLSNGVNNYIKRVEEDALSSYPLIVEKTTFSTDEIISSLMTKKEKTNQKLDKIYSNDIVVDMLSNMTKGIKSNNLKDFKTYLDNNTKIKDYVLDINYKYNITLNIYKNNKDKIIKVNPNDLFSSLMGNNNYQSSYSNYNVFTEMLNNQEVLKNQYEVLAGKYATEENELMLITNSNNEISDYVLYTLGIKDQMELQSIIAKVMKGESVSVNKTTYNYDDLLNLEYKLVLPTSYYQKINNKYNKIEDEEGIKKLIQEGMTLKIVGIIKEKENATSLAINGSIAYNKKLIQKVIQEINNSQIVKDQLNNKNINILTNEKFDNLTTYEDVLNQLNVYDFDNPSSVNLYMKDFESKKSVVKLINEYNKKQRENNLEENVIHYTDLVGTMIGSVSSIVNTISYVLIAFVTISLVVSSIMIGIITYISVIERTKEIGILRAIGASKKDISRVFNAETIIIGFTSGLFGIIITILLNIPINIIIKNITNISNISKLPIIGGIVLIIISIILTLIGGLIPAKIASKKDPVEALRVE